MFEELYNIIFIIIAGFILCHPHFSAGTIRAKNMSALLPATSPVAMVWYLLSK